MNDITNTAGEIDRLHGLAGARAAEAIEYARQAGQLLLKVKASLKHGEWLPWLEKNVSVSPRQAQRYIAVADGRTVPVRELVTGKGAEIAPIQKGAIGDNGPLKSDTVSHLTETIGPTAFVPEQDLCYIALMDDESTYLVEPASQHPGFFFVSRLVPDQEYCDCTRRPIRADWVDAQLKILGMVSPPLVAWRVRDSAGVLTAMESLSGVGK